MFDEHPYRGYLWQRYTVDKAKQVLDLQYGVLIKTGKNDPNPTRLEGPFTVKACEAVATKQIDELIAASATVADGSLPVVALPFTKAVRPLPAEQPDTQNRPRTASDELP